MTAQPVETQAPLEHVSRNIEAIRGYLGISQADLGHAIGAAAGSEQSAISKRLAGRIRWSLPELALVAGAVGCQLQHLVGPTSEIPWESLRWAARTPGFFHDLADTA